MAELTVLVNVGSTPAKSIDRISDHALNVKQSMLMALIAFCFAFD